MRSHPLLSLDVPNLPDPPLDASAELFQDPPVEMDIEAATVLGLAA